jgi:hypothetical protein
VTQKRVIPEASGPRSERQPFRVNFGLHFGNRVKLLARQLQHVHALRVFNHKFGMHAVP